MQQRVKDVDVTPHVGVWIETSASHLFTRLTSVTPHVGVWIETTVTSTNITITNVTPHVGVWIETNVQATPVGPLNLRYRRYFQSSSFKKETNSGVSFVPSAARSSYV